MRKPLGVLLFFSISIVSNSGILGLLESSKLHVKGQAELKKTAVTGEVEKNFPFQFDCYYLKDTFLVKTTTDRGVVVLEQNLKDGLYSFWGKGLDDFYINYRNDRLVVEANQYHPYGYIAVFNYRKNIPNVSLSEKTVNNTGEKQVTLRSLQNQLNHNILLQPLLHATFEEDVLKSISTETVSTEIDTSVSLAQKLFEITILDYFENDSSLRSVPRSLQSICYQFPVPCNSTGFEGRQEIKFTITSAVPNPVLSPDAIRRLLTSDLKKLDAPSKK